MKFSIVAIAIFATILGKASPVTRDDATDIVRPETAASLSNEDASSSPLLVKSDELSDHSERAGASCAVGLRAFGFARIADYTVLGHDFSASDLATQYVDGKFDNYGGVATAAAYIRAGLLPGPSQAFVQSQNANYFYHKQGDKATIIAGLVPDTRYATYIMGGCDQFAGNPDVFAHCCQ